MSKKMKKLALLASGTAFLPIIGSIPFVSNQGGGCYRNDAFANLFTNAGGAAIESLFDSPFFNDNRANSDYDRFVREPITDIAQEAWSDYVFGRYAADPQFPNLFAE
ncbi:MAG: hypothetical protein IPM64_02180 [Phycisphaerales bacterium]|nr:hypothetical protein [Phycisphaerales bacterium]